jgi:hypothetical protein
MDGPRDPQLAAGSSGTILGAREVPGGIPGAALSQPRGENAARYCDKMDESCAETRDQSEDPQIFSTTLSQLSHRGCCEGPGALTALDQARRRTICRCNRFGRGSPWAQSPTRPPPRIHRGAESAKKTLSTAWPSSTR